MRLIRMALIFTLYKLISILTLDTTTIRRMGFISKIKPGHAPFGGG